MSRSGFAERCARYVGEPPMQYRGRWRMQIAASLLNDGISLGSAAERVGYSSEAAFQRAFKEYTGIAPGRWRRQQAQRLRPFATPMAEAE